MKTFLAVLALASAASATFVFPAISLTAGTGTAATVGLLSASQVTIGAAAIAGLAIAKSALFLAAQADRRGKRSTTEFDFSPMIASVADENDCGKLLICHSFAQEDAKRTGEEKAIINLFDNLSVIQPSAYGKFQWAAYAGSFKDTRICAQRFSACPVSAEKLSNLISVQ
jgi:hypothetical protein